VSDTRLVDSRSHYDTQSIQNDQFLQLHYEILVAIEGHMSNNDEKAAKPTHIQHTSRLSYDKMMNHFNDLEAKGMILYRRTNADGLISITNKGKQFIK
jgi:predicted transcriptional regulator